MHILGVATLDLDIEEQRLFKSFEFGNGSRMSDEKLVILEFNISRTKNGRNKL